LDVCVQRVYPFLYLSVQDLERVSRLRRFSDDVIIECRIDVQGKSDRKREGISRFELAWLDAQGGELRIDCM